MTKFINGLFCCVIGWILILAIGGVLYSGLLAVVFLLFAALLLFWIVKKGYTLPTKANYKKYWIIVQLCSSVIMLSLVFGLEVDFSWDWGAMLQEAANYVETGELEMISYFARYPNNQLWLLILIGIFRLVKLVYPTAQLVHFKFVSMLVSCLLVQLTLFGIYRIGVRTWGEKRGFLTGVAAALCLPFYLYAQFAYTDTSGMLLTVLLLYFYIRARKAERRGAQIGWLIGVGGLAALAYHVKVMVFIVFLAIFIDLCLHLPNLKQRLLGATATVLSVCIVWLGLQGLLSMRMGIDSRTKDAYQFPLTHWVMMGLNETSSGGYAQEDVDYTIGLYPYNEKQQGTIKEIKTRIKAFGLSGLVRHIGFDKLRRTWTDPCMYGDNYVSRQPVYRNGMFHALFAENGVLHALPEAYAWAFHILLLFGMLVSGILAFSKTRQEQPMLPARLTVLGLAIFLMLWECNARYLVALLPTLLLTSAEGWFFLADRFKNNAGGFVWRKANKEFKNGIS